MKFYNCLQSNRVERDSFSLLPVQETDIEMIRNWRNEQVDILRQSHHISKEQQNEYFSKNIWNTLEHEHPKQILFSFFKDHQIIGYGGLVHINWLDKRAEISFLLATKYSKNIDVHCYYFENYLHLIQQVGFEDLDFHKLHAEVYDTRKYHTDIIEKCNFKLEGILREHILINNNFVNSLLYGKLKAEYYGY